MHNRSSVVFSTTCDFASITSTVTPFSFIFNQGSREKQSVRGTTVMLLLVKNLLVKKEM
jgi:hypothetical protein